MGNRTIIATDKAPAAIGPYSQAVRMGELLFCSGQVAIDPAVGKLVDGDAAVQAQQALENLSHVLAEAGAGFADIVKTTIFLVDMADFAAVNEVYAKRFDAAPPARSTVAVAGLPLGARFEIEAIVVLPPA